MTDEILKPCPFCGVKPRLYWEAWKDISPDAGVWSVMQYCPSCGARMDGEDYDHETD